MRRAPVAALALAVALVACSALAQVVTWGLDVGPAPGGRGAAIVALMQGSAAETAGLRLGDVVVRAQGRAIGSPDDFREASAAPAPELVMTVSRDGWEREIRIRAPAMPASYGLTVRARAAGGAEIASIAPNGPAAMAGLMPGDGVQGVEGRDVTDASALAALLDDLATRGQPVSLTVERANWMRQVTLAPKAIGGAAPASTPPSSVADAPLPARAIVPPPGSAPSVAASPPPREGAAATAGTAPPSAASPPPETSRPVAAPPPVALPPPAPPIPVPADVVTPDTPRTVRPPQSPAVAAGVRVDPVAEMNDANRAYEAGNWGVAATHYENVLAVIPDEPRSWGRLCHALVMQQRFADAAETCQDAAQFSKREASVFQNAGYSLFRLGKAPESIPWYERAISLAPDSALAYSGIGSAYFAMRNWAKAEESFRRMVALDASSQTGWQALADASGELGKSADAIAAYRRALSLGPSSPELLRGLGWQLYREGRYTDADAALREANRLNPKDANTLVTLGAVADKLGRAAEAREAWQRASELDPSGPLGAIARQGLSSLASRQAAGGPSGAVAAVPSVDVPRPPVAAPTEEPKRIVEPETDTGL